MKKAKTRIGSFLLVVVMLMSLLPTGVFAAEADPVADAVKYCDELKDAMASSPSWIQIGNAALSYTEAVKHVAALDEGSDKTAAEGKLNELKKYYNGITKLDMSNKTDGFLPNSDPDAESDIIDLHAAVTIFSNLETLNLSNNGLDNVGWLVDEKDDKTPTLAKLKTLNLSGNTGITEEAYGSLVHTSLENLNLSGTGIETIVPLTKHSEAEPTIEKTLVSLDVSNTKWSNFAELWKDKAPSLSMLKELKATNLKEKIGDIGALCEIANQSEFSAEQYNWDLSGITLDYTDGNIFDQLAFLRDKFKASSDNFKAPTVEVSEDLKPAILKDQSNEKKENLIENYAVTSKVEKDSTVVTITGDNLRKHQNGANPQDTGYWVGFALKAPVGAAKVKYSFAADKEKMKDETVNLEPDVMANGEDGIAFYIDVSAESPKKYARVQWLTTKENPLGDATEYTVDISGVTMLIEDPAIKAATLHDSTGAVADSYLYDKDSYDVTVTKKVGNSHYDVAITANNLRAHNNGNSESSFAPWVGFAIPAAKNVTHFKYDWAETIPEDAKVHQVEDISSNQTGVAAYLQADKGNKEFTVQWMSNESTKVGEEITYKVDLSGVTLNQTATTITGATVMEGGNVSTAISAAVNGGKISLSGLAAKASANLKLVLNTNAGGKVEKDISLTYEKDSGFSILEKDAQAVVAGKEYSIDVSSISAMPEKVKVEAGEVATEVGEGIAADDKMAVEAALKSIDVNAATVVVAQAANAEITKISNSLNVDELLKKANEEEPSKGYDTIKVVAYLNVTAVSYQAGNGTEEPAFTVNIQPMYKVVAANGNDESAPLMNSNLNVSSTAQPVEIKVGLPSGFVDESTTPVYVYHKNYVYGTTLEENDPFTATFINPHGFSTFTLKTTAGASVEDLNGQTTVYATLQDAVNAVKDGETITLLADKQEATVAKTVTFIVNLNGNKCVIKDGYGNPVTPEGNVYSIVYIPSSDDSGSVSGATSYGITVSAAEHGTVKSSNSTAAKDAVVTITVTPDKGYVLDTLTVTDKDGKAVSLTKVSDTQYTFKMPAAAVTVKGTFKQETAKPALPFQDVSESEWFYEAVKYAYEKGMMNGISQNAFAPYSNVNRAMIVQVLYNLEGKPAVAGSIYTDVTADQWYNNAVNWAAQKGIVNGYGDGTFGPMDNITREQMAAILYRYAQYKGYDVSAKGDLAVFTDGNNVSDWAKEAMSWTVGAGLFSGKGDGILDPGATALRCEVAKLLMTYCENVAK